MRGQKFLPAPIQKSSWCPYIFALNVEDLLFNFAYLGDRPTTTNVGFVRSLTLSEMDGKIQQIVKKTRELYSQNKELVEGATQI